MYEAPPPIETPRTSFRRWLLRPPQPGWGPALGLVLAIGMVAYNLSRAPLFSAREAASYLVPVWLLCANLAELLPRALLPVSAGLRGLSVLLLIAAFLVPLLL